MSIRHLEDAANLEMNPTRKLVFMALCDDANKLNRRTYPGMEKLLTWSGVSRPSVHRHINALCDDGLLLQVGRGMPGRRSEYIVFPTDEDRAKHALPDDDGADLEATDEPVDNPSGMCCTGATHSEITCLTSGGTCRTGATPPLRNSPSYGHLPKVSPELDGEVLHSDDRDSSIDEQLPKPGLRDRARLRRLSKSLDVDVLVDDAGRILTSDHGIDDNRLRPVLQLIAYRILAKALTAGTRVEYPTAYVLRAIRTEPEVWRRAAFAFDLDLHAPTERSTR